MAKNLCATTLWVTLVLAVFSAVPGPEATAQQGAVGRPASLEDLQRVQDEIQDILPGATASTVAVKVRWNHGSGVIVTADGMILTAGHVVGGPDIPAQITFSDGRTVRGVTLGVNHRLDSGMIKILDRGPWPFSPMADPQSIEVGEWCIAVGHPGGYEHDRGLVLRMGRVLDNSSWLLQSDCAIIQGDSGGPILDLEGAVIGIHSRLQWRLSSNFHVPIRTYHESWDRLVQKEEWGQLDGSGPVLGVHVEDSGEGCRVNRILEGFPAQQVGVRPEDLIQTINGYPVRNIRDLNALISDHRVGDRLEVGLLRGRRSMTVHPTLAKRE